MKSKMAKAINKVYETEDLVAKELCSLIESISKQAISEHGKFTVGFSGGSLAKVLCSGLPLMQTDWSRWHVFMCDERHVQHTHDDCNFKYYKDNLVTKGLPLNMYPSNPDVDLEQAAVQYETKLRHVFGDVDLPQFDLLLLGMGPDGHTCSLFPGHPAVKEEKRWVTTVSDSPKPPPERITLTLPVVNNARNVAFVSCGESKAAMVRRVLEDSEDPPLPASLVRPHNGNLYWFLDQPAARLLAQPATHVA